MMTPTRRVGTPWGLLTMLWFGIATCAPLALAQQGRPPENATPEEKRAFYQQRAAERARAAAESGEVSAPPVASARPPEGASPEEKRAFYQQRAAERARAEAGQSAPAGGAPGGFPSNPENPAGSHSGHSAGNSPGNSVRTPPVTPPASAAPGAAPGGRPTNAGAPGGMGSLGSMGGGRGGALWLSDSAPYRGDGSRAEGARGGMAGMGGMGGMGERKGSPVRRLWLRAGNDPQKSGFAQEEADGVDYLLVSPQGKPEGEAIRPEEGKRNLAVELPTQGFYRVYATTRRIQNDILQVSVAKAEIANFSHGGDEDEQEKGWAAQRVLEAAPMEIVRERAPDEKRFFQLKSGDQQGFVVLRKGVPVAGVRVRFISHQGWSKEAMSDEAGRVSFQVIRDYFPPWSDFQKRFKANYLLVAEASAAESGRYQDQAYGSVRYQATLAGNYYPSPEDYRSYAWGLGLTTLALLFSGTAVYLYRRRRVQPYREVRLDEAR